MSRVPRAGARSLCCVLRTSTPCPAVSRPKARERCQDSPHRHGQACDQVPDQRPEGRATRSPSRVPPYPEGIFGMPDQTLSIRHDSGNSARPYVDGALIAIRRVRTRSYGPTDRRVGLSEVPPRSRLWTVQRIALVKRQLNREHGQPYLINSLCCHSSRPIRRRRPGTSRGSPPV